MSGYNLGIAAGKVVIDASEATGSLGKVEAAARSVGDQVRSKVADVQEFGTKLQTAGAVGVAGFGLAVNAASKFQAALSAVSAVSGATASEMKLISDAALRIGKDTSFSATEAATAMEELVKAGISVDDVLHGAADATVALAAAGGVSLPAAAEIAANAMNQFGLDAGKMPRIADLIAGAANASAISVGDFGASLSQVGAVANLAGLSFDDTAVAIAEMGNAGIKGSDAGTSLKTMLMNLQPTTQKQATAFKQLGLLTFSTEKAMNFLRANGVKPLGTSQEVLEKQLAGVAAKLKGVKPGSAAAKKALEDLTNSTVLSNNAFFDSDGNLKSLRDIQGILAKSTSNLTKEQQLSTLETLFGADAIRAAAVLAGEGAAGYDKLSGAMAKVSAADVAKERLNNLSGATEELKGSFETAMIIIGNTVLPMVTNVVQGITKVINVFNNLPEGVQKAIAIFAGVVSVVLAVVGTILTLIPVIGTLIVGFLMFGQTAAIVGVLSAFFSALASGAGIAAAFGGALTGIGSIISTVLGRFQMLFRIASLVARGFALLTSGPVLAVVGILAAVGVAAVLLYRNFEPFRNLVDGVAAAISGKFTSAVNSVKGYLSELGEIFQSTVAPALDRIKKALSGAVDQFIAVGKAILSNIMPHLKDLQAELVALYAKFMGAVGPGTAIGGVFSAIGGFITGTVLPALASLGRFLAANIMPAFATVVEFLTGSFLPIFLTISKFLAGLFLTSVINGIQGVVQAISGALDVIIGIVKFFIAVFTGDWSGAWDAIKQIVTGVFDLIAGAISAFLNLSILKVFGLGFTALKLLFTSGWNLIKTFTDDVLRGMSGSISGIWNGIMAFFRAIFTTIQSIFTSAWGLIRGGTQSAVTGIQTVITTIMNAIRAFFQTIFTAYQTIFTTAWNIIRTGVQAVFSAMQATISGVMAAIRALIQLALTAIQTVFTTAWALVRTTTTTVFNAIRTVITTALSTIRSAITTALNTIRTGFTTAWNAVRSGVTTAWNGIVSGIQTGISSVLGFIRALPGQIVSALGNLGTLLLNAGRQIMDGLIAGIRAGIDQLKGVLSGITGMIPDLKGPAVVDRVLLTENGELIMQGLIRGIESQINPLANSLAGITASIPRSVETGMLTGLPALPPVAAPKAQAVTNHYEFGDITISAESLEEVRNVQEFFGMLRVSARRNGAVTVGA